MTDHATAQTNDGAPELLKSTAGIARHLGISVSTLYRWREFEGFPAAPMPDGRIMTTKTLIDQWLMARQELARQAKAEAKARKAKGLDPA